MKKVYDYIMVHFPDHNFEWRVDEISTKENGDRVRERIAGFNDEEKAVQYIDLLEKHNEGKEV